MSRFFDKEPAVLSFVDVDNDDDSWWCPLPIPTGTQRTASITSISSVPFSETSSLSFVSSPWDDDDDEQEDDSSRNNDGKVWNRATATANSTATSCSRAGSFNNLLKAMPAYSKLRDEQQQQAKTKAWSPRAALRRAQSSLSLVAARPPPFSSNSRRKSRGVIGGNEAASCQPQERSTPRRRRNSEVNIAVLSKGKAKQQQQHRVPLLTPVVKKQEQQQLNARPTATPRSPPLIQEMPLSVTTPIRRPKQSTIASVDMIAGVLPPPPPPPLVRHASSPEPSTSTAPNNKAAAAPHCYRDNNAFFLQGALGAYDQLMAEFDAEECAN